MGEVICYNCKETVYRLTKEIRDGDYVSADQLEGINGHEVTTKGDVVICPNCQSSSGIGSGVQRAAGVSISS